MEQLYFHDQSIEPSGDTILCALGDRASLWNLLFGQVRSGHPDFVETWRYYKDGRGWLLNVSRKGKTVFWLALYDGSFRTTFYLTQRAKDVVEGSALSEGAKKQFRDCAGAAKLRGISIGYQSERDVEDAMILVEIKLAVK